MGDGAPGNGSSRVAISVDFGRGWVEKGEGTLSVGVCDTSTPVFVVRSGRGVDADILLEEVLLDDIYAFDDDASALTFRSDHHAACIRIVFATARYYRIVRYFTRQYFGINTDSDDIALDDVFGHIRVPPPASCAIPCHELELKMLEGYQRVLCRADLTLLERHVLGACMVVHGHAATAMHAMRALQSRETTSGSVCNRGRELAFEVTVAIVALGHAPLFRAVFTDPMCARALFAGMWGMLGPQETAAKEARLAQVLAGCWGGRDLSPVVTGDPEVRRLTECWVYASFLSQEVLAPGCEEYVREALAELDSQLKAEIALAVSARLSFPNSQDQLLLEGGAGDMPPCVQPPAQANLAWLDVMSRMIGGIDNIDLQAAILSRYYQQGMLNTWAAALRDATGGDRAVVEATARDVLYQCVTRPGIAGLEDVLTPCRTVLMAEGSDVMAVWVDVLFLRSEGGDTDALFHLLGLHDAQGAQPGRAGAVGDAMQDGDVPQLEGGVLPITEGSVGLGAAAGSPEDSAATGTMRPAARDCLLGFISYFCTTHLDAVAQYLAHTSPAAAPDSTIRAVTLLRALINTAPDHAVGVVECALRAGVYERLSQCLFNEPHPRVPKACALAFLQLLTESVVSSGHPWVGAALTVHRVPQHLGVLYGRERGMLQSAVLGLWKRLAAPAAAAAPASRDLRRALCTVLPQIFAAGGVDAGVVGDMHRAALFDLQCDMEERVDQHTRTQLPLPAPAVDPLAAYLPAATPATCADKQPPPTTPDTGAPTARSLDFTADAYPPLAATSAMPAASPATTDDSRLSTPCSIGAQWAHGLPLPTHITPASDATTPESALSALRYTPGALAALQYPPLPALPVSPGSPSRSLDALYELSSPSTVEPAWRGKHKTAGLRSAETGRGPLRDDDACGVHPPSRRHLTLSTLLDTPCSAISNSTFQTDPGFMSEFPSGLPFALSPALSPEVASPERMYKAARPAVRGGDKWGRAAASGAHRTARSRKGARKPLSPLMNVS